MPSMRRPEHHRHPRMLIDGAPSAAPSATVSPQTTATIIFDSKIMAAETLLAISKDLTEHMSFSTECLTLNSRCSTR